MMSSAVIAFLFIAPATAVLRGRGQQSMEPEVVSELLSNVEQKWVQGQMMVMRNVTDEATSYSTMEASCLKVASAIVTGSEGEKDRVVEYMQDVCGSVAWKGPPGMCSEFASGVTGAMTDDESFNREGLDLKPFCKKFWEQFVAAAAQAEKQRLDTAEAEKEAERKKREEEEHEEELKRQDELAQKRKEEAAEKAKEEAEEEEEAAKEAAEAKAKEPSLVVKQNVTEAQSQNTTVAEVPSDTQPAAEVPQTNATAAIAVESEPAAAAPAENVNATETEAAPTKAEASTEPAMSAKK